MLGKILLIQYGTGTEYSQVLHGKTCECSVLLELTVSSWRSHDWKPVLFNGATLLLQGWFKFSAEMSNQGLFVTRMLLIDKAYTKRH